MDSLVIDRPACTACAHPYRPPRLGDLLHARLGDGPEHATMLESVGDDGETLKLVGPVGRQDLVIVIRRVGGTP
jgi:hypothetical protein